MQITSSEFKNGELIPSVCTCDGENAPPSLVFSEVPDAAKSLALIMEDPDVPKSLRPDGMFDHWIVWNIPPETKYFSEGMGTTGKNTRGNNAYTGPCPPDREHRYFFKLYALDTLLKLDWDTTKSELLSAMKNHIVEEVELVGRYERVNSVKK